MEELRTLVARVREGDLDAYGEIVQRFQDMAYGYAYALLGDFHLAQDAAQDAFIRAYRDLGKLKDPAAFPGWFRRLVFKYCDRRTRGKGPSTVPLESMETMRSERPGPPEKAQKREMAERVLAAIHSLPEEQRTVTTLYYIDGYSQKEVAEFLEVPVTTVNSRLYASRQRLKERMTAMVADTIREHALPEGFADMVKKLVLFPEKEPGIEISRAEAPEGSVRWREDQAFFAPLVEGGESLVSWYDWPERELTGTACARVTGRERVAGMNCYRERITDFDLDQRWTHDHVWYWAVEDGRIYLVAKANFEPGAGDPVLQTWDDSDWDEERTGWPVEMDLKSRVDWDADLEGAGLRFPRKPVAGGVWRVRAGERDHQCLRMLSLSYCGRREGRTPAELAGKYLTLVDYYIDMDGRTVLFRRYNGPAWRAESPGALEKLREKGCPSLRYNGVEFRLWYDCFPLHALRPAGE